MSDLATVAPAFVEMAHRIVWASVATVDDAERPWKLRVFPGTVLVGKGGDVLTWTASRG